MVPASMNWTEKRLKEQLIHHLAPNITTNQAKNQVFEFPVDPPPAAAMQTL